MRHIHAQTGIDERTSLPKFQKHIQMLSKLSVKSQVDDACPESLLNMCLSKFIYFESPSMRMQQMNTKTTIFTQLPLPRKRKSVTSRALFAPKKMIKISLAETFSSMSEYQVL